MEITHPEILKSEKFGSRTDDENNCRCIVCGGEDKGDGYISAIAEFFCSENCRFAKNIYMRRIGK